MTMNRRIALRVAALCGVSLAAIGINAGPASAHATTLVVGANSGSVNASHTQVTVCDNENDGNDVYAQFVVYPYGLPVRYYDSYGGSCSTYPLTTSRFTTSWSLCEVGSACALTFL
jgi:hypothetical protein